MKNGSTKKKTVEKNSSRKSHKEHFIKLIKLSHKRNINSLLKNSLSKEDFKGKISKILQNESYTQYTYDKKIQEWILESEKLFSLNILEDQIIEKVDTLNKLEKDINSMNDMCLCNELTQAITEKFQKDTLSHSDINKVINMYNTLIDEISHLDSF